MKNILIMLMFLPILVSAQRPKTYVDAREHKRLFPDTLGVGTTTPNSLAQINGSLSIPYVEKTANYTAGYNDYTINCTANSFTITLPTAVGIKGRVYVIINSGAGTITVATTSSQTIDLGSLSIAPGQSFMLQSTNANWAILCHKLPPP